MLGFVLRVELDWVQWVSIILLSLFGLIWLVQLIQWLMLHSKLMGYTRSEIVVNYRPVSVIVCAKNEEDNLVKFLPLVLNQQYDEFEVVVVNDCSYDNTGDILEEFAKKYAHLRIVTIKEDENYRHGKKFAVMCGIKGAKYEHLIFTDADCFPNSTNWVREVMTNYNDASTEIVLGYGGFEKKKGFANKLIRFDALTIALNYFYAAIKGKAYMGVGRNLSYKKSLFFKHKGFASHYFIESGDDDLFVNESATRHNTKIEVKPDSFTYSIPKNSFKEWYYQKRRHITTYPYYQPESKRRLFWVAFFLYGFWLLFLPVVFLGGVFAYVALGCWFVRLLVKYILFARVFQKFNEKDLLPLLFIYEVILLFTYPAIRISNTFMKKNAWKS